MSAQYRPYRDEDGSDGLDNEQLNWSDNEPGSIQIYEKTTEDLPFSSNRRALIGVAALVLLSLLCGFLIGFFGHGHGNDCVPTLSVALHSVRDEDPTIKAKILEKVHAESIRSVVQEFARGPRIPGTAVDLKLAKQVADFFHAHSLDKVEIKNYSVLLSVPDEHKPNVVEIVQHNSGFPREVLYTSLPADDNGTANVASPYCAYSPNADITGDLVYVNYGRLSDFQTLKEHNISLGGKILIAKQLLLAADEQLIHAQEVNAAGLLLYPDTEQSKASINSNRFSHLKESQVPGDAVRRDSLLWNGMGDPQTPGYPSTPYAFRLPLQAIKILPKIPVQPISFDTAYELLGLMGGKEAPENWGGVFNFTYHLGPGFQNKSLKLHLQVNNRLVNRTVHNVIGYIRGKVEPDRYVIIGNHRDSWVKGAVDAAGGTGSLLELSKVFGDLLGEGWRPRRTLMFCSWGAEEFNLIGSTEWLEEHMKILQARAVAYINTDIMVIGNVSLSVAASPLLYQTVFNATKQVSNPDPAAISEGSTVYDKWLATFPLMRNSSVIPLFNSYRAHRSNLQEEFLYDYDSEMSISKRGDAILSNDYTETGSILNNNINSATIQIRPRVRPLDMRSVYAPFFTLAGIPVVEVSYVPSAKDSEAASLSYPLIHTQYDTLDLIETFDKDFRYHKAVTQVVGEIARDLADSLFLPFNLLDYAQVLKDLYLTLHLHAKDEFKSHGITFAWLDSAIHNFTEAAVRFHSKQDRLDLRDPMAIRRVNDQLLLLERAFLDSNGLPRNPTKKHVVLSPSETSPPYDEMFPGLMDEFALLVHADLANPDWSWDIIRAHFSILVYTIESAAQVIGDVV